jgi:lysophospholipase L1-like esterase
MTPEPGSSEISDGSQEESMESEFDYTSAFEEINSGVIGDQSEVVIGPSDSNASSDQVSSSALSSASSQGSSSQASSSTQPTPTSGQLSPTTGQPTPTTGQIDTSLGVYDLYLYLRPYWEGNQIYNETVLMYKNPDNTITGTLLYDAVKVQAVRNSSLDTLYKEGADYTVSGDTITLPAGSDITYLTSAEVYSNVWQTNYMLMSDGRFVSLYPVGYKDYYQPCIVVTYTHNHTGFGSFVPPPFDESRLPKTIAKLKNGQSLKIVAYGDSITVGANGSGFDNIPPKMPNYPTLVQQKLHKVYPSATISLVNTAVGGKSSNWGCYVEKDEDNNIDINNARDRVAAYSPDLVLISFGMGDAHSVNKFSPDTVKSNIASIIATVRLTRPDCEFIIVTAMNANPLVPGFVGSGQDKYPEVLKTLEETGVVVADVNTAHGVLLQKKSFISIGGNSVNHPNDFVYRLYAQVILNLLIE